MRQLSPQKPCIICRFQYSDTRRDLPRGNTQEGIQSSTYSRLCSSAPVCQKALILLLRHCGRTSKGIYRSEPGELPTSLFLPLLPISYRNCSGRRRIYFLWNASAWLGTPDMIRYITAFTTSTHTGSGLCIQSEQQICWRDPCLTTKSAAAPTRNTNQKTSP